MIEDTLVEQALHLPRREARRWAHTPLEQEDLVADGNLALAKAAKRYDPSYGVPFPAFATPYVRGADGQCQERPGVRAPGSRPHAPRHRREPRPTARARDDPGARAHCAHPDNGRRR